MPRAKTPRPERGPDALRTLFDVGRVLASTLDFTALLQKILTLTRETIGSETASVMLADPVSQSLTLVCAEGLPAVARRTRAASHGGSIAEWVFRRGEPVLLNGNPNEDDRFRDLGARDHIRSALSVPLVGKNGPVGVLSLNNCTRRPRFTAEDLDLLTAIGIQAGIAVENARLHRQVAETNRELTATVDHLRNLTSSLIRMTEPSLEASLQTMLDAAVEGTGARAGLLSVLDEDESSYTFSTTAHESGHGLAGGEDGREAAAEAIAADHDSLMAVSDRSPHTMVRVLTAAGRPVGLLKLVARAEGGGFDARDGEFVDALVEHASIVVYNNMLYQQTEAGRQALETAYRELSAKQEQLIHSEKLAAIGEMAAKVCHEINNPLTAISGCTQLMRRKLSSEKDPPAHAEDYDRYLGTIAAETERCSRITGDLLQSTRRTAVSFHAFDLHDILNHTAALLEHGGRRGVAVVADFDFEIPRVVGDAQQLTQVFLNLLTNAADAMPEGGRIHVTTRRTRASETPVPFVRIAIRDEGPGIPDAALPLLFQPFHTTKAGGTGLGLTICKGIVEKHNGSLRLSNAPAGGAEAVVLLPQDAAVAAEMIAPAPPPDAAYAYTSDLAQVLLSTGAMEPEEADAVERTV